MRLDFQDFWELKIASWLRSNLTESPMSARNFDRFQVFMISDFKFFPIKLLRLLNFGL